MRTAALLILCVLASTTVAQPTGVNRVLRSIDFEERRLGNNEDLPMHWLKVEGPGFPHYVNARLADDRAHSGEYGFRFDLNGGSLLYRYEPTQIKIHPGAGYRIEAWVQTTVLQHARARVTGYFTDIDSRPLVSSVRHSELYAATRSDAPWRKLSIDLTALSTDAAYLVLELELLQPEVYADSPLGRRALHPQEIHGSAWFDDITIQQVPRVNLATSQPGNLFRHDQAMAVSMEVHDAFTEDLAVQMGVRDAMGRTVYQRSGAAEFVGGNSPYLKRATIPLPDLAPGWYEVMTTTSSQGMPLASRSINVVRLADDAPAMPDDRFGVIATGLPFECWGDLTKVLPLLGVGRVKLGVWSKTADAANADPAAFDVALTRLRDARINTVACLLELPPRVSTRINEQLGLATSDPRFAGALSWLRLVRANDESWHAPLEDLLARHSVHLNHWQLGADGTDVFASQPAMREAYGKVYATFAALLRQPDLAMPWPAWYEVDGKLPAGVALSIPPSILPAQMPLYLQDLHSSDSHQVSISLQLLDRERYGHDVQTRDFAQRIVYALSAGAERIDLPCPFTPIGPADGTEASAAQQPTDLFPVMHTLMSALGGAHYVGRVAIADGIESFLFDRAGQGVLVLWDNGRANGLRQLPLNLGDAPRMMDLYGNDIPVLHPANDAAGTVQLVVGPMPVFLTNIDGPLAQLRASVALDRSLIESAYTAHARRIRFRNTYPMHITGSFKLKAPKGWTITPTVQDFSLNAGETFDREFTIEFPASSAAGARSINAEFIIQSEKTATFRMPLQVKLGLSDVGMQTLAIRDGRDVVIQQVIHNYSSKPIDYTAFAVFPGQARQERLVTELAPGQSTVKRYRFKNVSTPKGSAARVGVKELEGSRVLNDDVEIP